MALEYMASASAPELFWVEVSSIKETSCVEDYELFFNPNENRSSPRMVMRNFGFPVIRLLGF